MKKLTALLIVLLGISLLANASYAAVSVLPSHTDYTDIITINENNIVLIDHNARRVDLVDLKTNKMINLSNDGHLILDVEIMNNPQKIVLLKESNSTKIVKNVFSYKGLLLSKTEIPLKSKLADAQSKIKWVPPTGTVNERMMVQSMNSFELYQYPWTKPSVVYNANWINSGYESVIVSDWDFTSYPYLAIKYQAQGIGRNDYFLKIMNLYTKKELLFSDYNTDFDFKLVGNNLSVFTSYTYQAVPSNVIRPKDTDLQTYYRVINVVTGQQAESLQGKFSEDINKQSGWETMFNQQQLFVGDKAQETWSLYSATGEQILNHQVWPKDSKFVSYNVELRTSYFLTYISGKPSIITVTEP